MKDANGTWVVISEEAFIAVITGGNFFLFGLSWDEILKRLDYWEAQHNENPATRH